ncbi:MAG: cytidine deaminase [Clostridia bacterium]|nr:cytidine deaminase [Clostridia bacterium]
MEEMIKRAFEVRKFAHVRKYKVGAVLKTKDGKLYTGCNVDNMGIQSICAERTAFVKAISEGETEYDSILVVGGDITKDKLDNCTPCGYCRQFMRELVSDDFKVFCYDGENMREYLMKDLLPEAFEV